MKRKSNELLLSALSRVGEESVFRDKVIEICLEFENNVKIPEQNIRDNITGVIIDALHSNIGISNVKLKSGLVFYYSHTSKIAREIVLRKEETIDHIWEPQTTKLLTHFSKKMQHIVIGGAYFGDHAIIVANEMRTNGGICHAFEANSDSFEILIKNTESNHLDNIKMNNCGLWENDESRIVLVGDDEIAAYPKEANCDDREAISTITINSYGVDNKIESLGLIMLDIEGAELQALKGATHYLSQSTELSPIIVFEVHRNYCDWTNGLESTEIFQFLEPYDYKMYAIRDYQGHVQMDDCPVELVPIEGAYLEGPPHGFNVLALKNENLLNDQLFRITPDVSPKLLFHRDPKLHQPIHMNE